MKRSISGFTLIEVLITVVIVGVLAALTTPNLMGLLMRQKLNATQNNALSALREAQTRAKQQSQKVQVCFRSNSTNGSQFLIQTISSTSTTNCSGTTWQNLAEGSGGKINISSSNMTLRNSVSSIRFHSNGWLDSQEGTTPLRITFAPQGNTYPQRCVQVTTRLGAMRTDGDDNNSTNKCS